LTATTPAVHALAAPADEQHEEVAVEQDAGEGG
jgi:hypothetical protein